MSGVAVPGYSPITAEQAEQIALVRKARAEFFSLLHSIGGTPDIPGAQMRSANLTLAMRHIEDAEYRAVRHITGGAK